MKPLSTLATWGMLILLGGFFALVFWKLVTRGIRLDELLQGDQWEETRLATSFSPGRAQLLIFTLLLAVHFLLQVIHDASRFPQIPPAWLAALGGSQAGYLGGKAYSMLGKKALIDYQRRSR
jgi:hypothetical protein